MNAEARRDQMTPPNRLGSKAGRRRWARAAPRPPSARSWGAAKPPPLARSSVTPGPRPTQRPLHLIAIMPRVASLPRVRSVALRPRATQRLRLVRRLASLQGTSPPPTHTQGRSSPPPPLPSTVTIPVPVPKAASAHGPKRIEIWERGTDGRAREGLRLRSGYDRWRRRLRCWGGGRRGALSLRRAVSRRRRHRRRLSRRRREQNTENRGYKISG